VATGAWPTPAIEVPIRREAGTTGGMNASPQKLLTVAAILAMAALPLTAAQPAAAKVTAPATDPVTSPMSGSASDPPPLLRCHGPWPHGYRQLHSSWSCDECLERGDAGIARGDWREYQCRAVPVGLDVFYYLFVR
jgi:hypothetical protein